MLLASLMALTVATQAAQVEPVLRVEIGSADGGLEEVFGRISDLAADASGDVYILDETADRVRVFSSSGRYRTTFGQRGREAGQLNRPRGIDVHGETVTVLNPSSQSVSYTLRGAAIEAYVLPFGAFDAVRVAEGRYVALVSAAPARRDPAPTESIIVLGPESTDTLLTVATTDVLYRSPTVTSSIRTSLCKMAHFAVGDAGEVWGVSGVDGTLTEWRTGNGLTTVARWASVAPPRAPLPDSLRARVLETVPRQLDPATGDLYVPSMLSSVCGLERSTDGTLWIRLADVEGRELWHALDAETLAPTRELHAPAGTSIRAFSGALAYGVRNDDGVFRVMVYNIE
jgi:hypothetical protein